MSLALRKQLNTAERGIAIKQVNSLVGNSKFAFMQHQFVRCGDCQQDLIVLACFNIVHRGSGCTVAIVYLIYPGPLNTWLHRLLGFCEKVRAPLSRSTRNFSMNMSSYIKDVNR